MLWMVVDVCVADVMHRRYGDSFIPRKIDLQRAIPALPFPRFLYLPVAQCADGWLVPMVNYLRFFFGGDDMNDGRRLGLASLSRSASSSAFLRASWAAVNFFAGLAAAFCGF